MRGQGSACSGGILTNIVGSRGLYYGNKQEIRRAKVEEDSECEDCIYSECLITKEPCKSCRNGSSYEPKVVDGETFCCDVCVWKNVHEDRNPCKACDGLNLFERFVHYGTCQQF